MSTFVKRTVRLFTPAGARKLEPIIRDVMIRETYGNTFCFFFVFIQFFGFILLLIFIFALQYAPSTAPLGTVVQYPLIGGTMFRHVPLR